MDGGLREAAGERYMGGQRAGSGGAAKGLRRKGTRHTRGTEGLKSEGLLFVR